MLRLSIATRLALVPAAAFTWRALADPSLPPRFVQTGHTTPWTWPAASTKTVCINEQPGGQPVPTPYLVDWNVEHIVYRLKDVDQRNATGNVCCQDVLWTHDVRLTFAVESEHLTVGTDVVPYNWNPQTESAATPLPPVGTTPTGLVYEFVFPSSELNIPVWLALKSYPTPPTPTDLHIVDMRIVGAPSQPFGGLSADRPRRARAVHLAVTAR
ncbi:MAG: hypothetical protein GY711_09135 [bacterium]|nr:hypothetical protein [bacterium]